MLTYRAFLTVFRSARWLGQCWRGLYNLAWLVSPRVGAEAHRCFDSGYYATPEPDQPTLAEFLRWCDADV